MAVPAPAPPPPPANGTGPTLIEQLTPGLLERLRGVFADAAAESLHDYPVDKATVRTSANDALTESSVIAAAEQVTLPNATVAILRKRAREQAQKEFNNSLAEQVVAIDVIPAFIRNLTLRENFTQLMFDDADPPAFHAAVAVAGENASLVATHTAVEEVDAYKTEVAQKAYSSVRDATVRIAKDVAVNTITYNLEEKILSGVTFDPAEVMARAHKTLKAENAAQQVAEEVSGLLAMRAKTSKANATNATAA